MISSNKQPSFITKTGIKLYLDNKMVKILNAEIKRQKLKGVQVFLSIDQNNYKEYVLVIDGNPYLASQKSDEISGMIDMLAVKKRYE